MYQSQAWINTEWAKLNAMLFNIITFWNDKIAGWGFMLLEIQSEKWDHTRGFFGLSYIRDGRAIGLDFFYFYREFKIVKPDA